MKRQLIVVLPNQVMLRIGAALLLLAIQNSVFAGTLNFAAAFTWHGYMDTDLAVSEFFSEDHTIMARFMLQHPKAYEGPIVTVNGTGTYFIGQGNYEVTGNKGAKLVVKIGNAKATYTLPNLVAGQWLHVALVQAGDTWIGPDVDPYFSYRYSFYLNGVYHPKDGGGNLEVLPNLLMPKGKLRLGTTNPVPTTSLTQFYGFVDDLAVFNKALTASEVKNIYNNPLKRLTGNEPSLLAGYTFDAATPAGQPLPLKLNRPVTIVGPAYKALVTQTRHNPIDAGFLPLPVHQVSLRLPFNSGQVWKVTQGNEGNSATSVRLRSRLTW